MVQIFSRKTEKLAKKLDQFSSKKMQLSFNDSDCLVIRCKTEDKEIDVLVLLSKAETANLALFIAKHGVKP